jgi:hypothetical protein
MARVAEDLDRSACDATARAEESSRLRIELEETTRRLAAARGDGGDVIETAVNEALLEQAGAHEKAMDALRTTHAFDLEEATRAYEETVARLEREKEDAAAAAVEAAEAADAMARRMEEDAAAAAAAAVAVTARKKKARADEEAAEARRAAAECRTSVGRSSDEKPPTAPKPKPKRASDDPNPNPNPNSTAAADLADPALVMDAMIANADELDALAPAKRAMEASFHRVPELRRALTKMADGAAKPTPAVAVAATLASIVLGSASGSGSSDAGDGPWVTRLPPRVRDGDSPELLAAFAMKTFDAKFLAPEVRSILWSPYDPVRVVDADP